MKGRFNMKAEAIIFREPDKPTFGEVDLPDLKPNEMRVRTLISGVSIGTERLLWSNRLRYCQFPAVLGYQAVAVVEEVGGDVPDLQPGDKVLHRRGRLEGEVASRSGAHASHAVVARDQALPAAPGLDDAQGSLFVLPCVGFHGVTMAQVRYDELVAVQGLGLVGLGVVAAARLRGATVVAIDVQANRLQAAREMGADVCVNAKEEDPVAAVHRLQDGGADVVFEATGITRCLNAAFGMARRLGRFVFQGNYGDDDPVSFTFHVPHGKQLTTFFPCNDGLLPCRRAVTQLMARGAIDFSPAITHRVSPREAVGVYRALIENAVEPIGIVIDWK
jgi:2-desacetyl-2-hydroxyethyl bacteriochlorophyllide A dehydrogenase